MLSSCRGPADCDPYWTLNGPSGRHGRFHGVVQFLGHQRLDNAANHIVPSATDSKVRSAGSGIEWIWRPVTLPVKNMD